MKPHGTISAYQRGCRCRPCKDAVAAYQRAWVAQRKTEEKPAHIHGTTNGYVNYRCRCVACRAAQAASIKQQKTLRRSRTAPAHVHGTYNGYSNYACRCAACLVAHREYARDYRRRKLSATARGVVSRSEVCKNGHRLEGEHLYVRPDGRKMCRTCQRARDASRKRSEMK